MTGPAVGGAPAGPGTSDGRQLAVLAHLGCVIGGFLLPLIIYLVSGPKDPYVRHHSAEALNFQLTYFLVFLIVLPFSLAFMLAIGRTTLNTIGFIMLMAVFGANVAFGIVGAVKASKGEWWRYPVAIGVVRR